jgi:hypothetical protein
MPRICLFFASFVMVQTMVQSKLRTRTNSTSPRSGQLKVAQQFTAGDEGRPLTKVFETDD